MDTHTPPRLLARSSNGEILFTPEHFKILEAAEVSELLNPSLAVSEPMFYPSAVASPSYLSGSLSPVHFSIPSSMPIPIPVPVQPAISPSAITPATSGKEESSSAGSSAEDAANNSSSTGGGRRRRRKSTLTNQKPSGISVSPSSTPISPSGRQRFAGGGFMKSPEPASLPSPQKVFPFNEAAGPSSPVPKKAGIKPVPATPLQKVDLPALANPSPFVPSSPPAGMMPQFVNTTAAHIEDNRENMTLALRQLLNIRTSAVVV